MMELIKVDVMDGNGPITVAVSSTEANRLRDFLKEARDMFKEMEECDDPRANGWVGQDGRP